jgi:hypothetical protein
MLEAMLQTKGKFAKLEHKSNLILNLFRHNRATNPLEFPLNKLQKQCDILIQPVPATAKTIT